MRDQGVRGEAEATEEHCKLEPGKTFHSLTLVDATQETPESENASATVFYMPLPRLGIEDPPNGTPGADPWLPPVKEWARARARTHSLSNLLGQFDVRSLDQPDLLDGHGAVANQTSSGRGTCLGA